MDQTLDRHGNPRSGKWRNRRRDSPFSSTPDNHSDHGAMPPKEGHRTSGYTNGRPGSAFNDTQDDYDWSRRHSNSRDRDRDRRFDDAPERVWNDEYSNPDQLEDDYRGGGGAGVTRPTLRADSDRRSTSSSRQGRDRTRDSSRDRDARDRSFNSRDRERERERPRDREREFRGSRRDEEEPSQWEGRARGWNNDDEGSATPPARTQTYDRFAHAGAGRFRSDGDTLKMEPPNCTVMIRGLPPVAKEEEIRQDILECNLMPKAVRIVKEKSTGSPRGIAFVEFATLQDSSHWMETKQGVLMLHDQRALIYYTRDWCCSKCGCQNFRQKGSCYKCHLPREETDLGEGMDEVTYHPTKTILLRKLDSRSTVGSVMEAIKSFRSVHIVSVRIGQDALTNTSRGLCYIDLGSEMDALILYAALAQNPPYIDGQRVLVSFYKPPGDPPHNPLQPGVGGVEGRWPDGTAGGSTDLSQYTLEDVPRLAEYSASMYATTPLELASYISYYKQYYHTQLSALPATPPASTISAPPLVHNNQSDAVNAAAALAQGAIRQAMAAKVVKKSMYDTSVRLEGMAAYGFPTAAATNHASLPAATNITVPYIGASIPGATVVKYPTPDVSTYQYDESSGHYYDTQTGLYYDATSQYFFNSHAQQFLYWDAEQHTYVPAPNPPVTGAGVAAATPAAAAAAVVVDEQKDDSLRDDTKKGKDKLQDKVKVAKKIAKDMERWAKTLNQKKETFNQITANAPNQALRSGGAADACFAILQRKDPSELAPAVAEPDEPTRPPPAGAATGGLVAAYGVGSDSEEEIEDVVQEERQHTDWTKLACLLCKRQFDKKETLLKHQQVSDLHKQNMDAWYRVRGLDANDPTQRNNRYRDRANERRLKFGQPKVPQPNRLKEKYLKARDEANSVSYEEPTKAGIGADNLGNKMLQKMGWQEGMGLGKANQGRTSIIQTNRRAASAGLGVKGSAVGAVPGETYKDFVKKMTYSRYQELTEQ